MKNFIILTMLLAFTTVSFAQQATPNTHWKDSDLYKKSKTQKIVGWSLVGAGMAGMTATLIADMNQGTESTIDQIFSNGTYKPAYKSYTTYYVISSVVIAGGLYFLISSTINKKKAMATSVFINMENAPKLQGTVFSNQSFPVLGVRIHL